MENEIQKPLEALEEPGFFQKIWNSVTDAAESVGEFFQQVGDGIADAFAPIVDKVEDAAKEFVDFMKESGPLRQVISGVFSVAIGAALIAAPPLGASAAVIAGLVALGEVDDIAKGVEYTGQFINRVKEVTAEGVKNFPEAVKTVFEELSPEVKGGIALGALGGVVRVASYALGPIGHAVRGVSSIVTGAGEVVSGAVAAEIDKGKTHTDVTKDAADARHKLENTLSDKGGASVEDAIKNNDVLAQQVNDIKVDLNDSGLVSKANDIAANDPVIASNATGQSAGQNGGISV